MPALTECIPRSMEKPCLLGSCQKPEGKNWLLNSPGGYLCLEDLVLPGDGARGDGRVLLGSWMWLRGGEWGSEEAGGTLRS